MTHEDELTVAIERFLCELDDSGLGGCICEQNAEDYVRPCPVHAPSESERVLANKCLQAAAGPYDKHLKELLSKASEVIDRQVRRQDSLVSYLRKIAAARGRIEGQWGQPKECDHEPAGRSNTYTWCKKCNRVLKRDLGDKWIARIPQPPGDRTEGETNEAASLLEKLEREIVTERKARSLVRQWLWNALDKGEKMEGQLDAAQSEITNLKNEVGRLREALETIKTDAEVPNWLKAICRGALESGDG